MTEFKTMRWMRPLAGALTLAAAAAFGGCEAPAEVTSVSPIGGRGTLALEPDEVVITMRRAGFTDEQILELGPAIRNNLATQGGARVSQKSLTRAMFMVYGDEVYGVAVDRGTFRYSREQGAVDELVPPPEEAIQAAPDAPDAPAKP